MKTFSIIALLVISISKTSSQSNDLDSLLKNTWTITESTDIKSMQSVKQIVKQGSTILLTLATYFIDSTLTTVYSSCQNAFLTRGEVVMIIADRIEMMPYALVTGIQNCIFQFCPNNDNRIEYYFPWIRNDEAAFRKRYVDWLKSKERRKWKNTALAIN